MSDKLDRDNIENILNLTNMQQGMLFHYISDKDSKLYLEQLSISISGEIKLDLLQKAWDYTIQRNEMLRTIYRWEKLEHPIQIVLKRKAMTIKNFDLTNSKDIKSEIERIKSEDLMNRIDIRKETIRVYLCKLDNQDYEMIISSHHILYDGWSNSIILQEVTEAYHSLYKGKDLTIKYKTKYWEFIKHLKKSREDRNEEYWKRYMKDYKADNFFLSTSNNNRKLAKFNYSFSEELTQQLNEYCKEQRVSLASVFYSTWGIVLQKLNDSTDVVFGTVVSGRNVDLKNIDEMIGLFINTLPIRIISHADETLLELINNTYHSMKERNEFEQSSLVDIHKYCNIHKNEVLFNSIVGVENYPINLNHNNLFLIKNISIDSFTNFDLALEIRCFNNIELYFDYNCNVVSESLIKKLAECFEKIVQVIVYDCNRKIEDLEIVYDNASVANLPMHQVLLQESQEDLVDFNF